MCDLDKRFCSSKLLDGIFTTIIISIGLEISYESIWFESYRFHEINLIFYSVYLIVSICSWLKWKKMIFIFIFVQICNFIGIHMIYSDIPLYFYCGFICLSVIYPWIVMMIAKVLLEFIHLIHKNEELVRIFKHILQVFPEAVLIQTYDEKTKKIVFKFANDVAKRDILNYDSAFRNSAFSDKNSHHSFDLLDQPVADKNLNYIFTEVEKMRQGK